MQGFHGVAELAGEGFPGVLGIELVIRAFDEGQFLAGGGGMLVNGFAGQVLPARRHPDHQQRHADVPDVAHRGTAGTLPADAPHPALVIAEVLLRLHRVGGEVVLHGHDPGAVHHVVGQGHRVFRRAQRADDLHRDRAVRVDERMRLIRMGHETDILGIELVVEEHLVGPGDHQRLVVDIVPLSRADEPQPLFGRGEDAHVSRALRLLKGPDKIIRKAGARGVKAVFRVKEIQ